MEKNLQGVGNILDNLKNMSSAMGSEIERQNKQLDLIHGKVRISLVINTDLSTRFLAGFRSRCEHREC